MNQTIIIHGILVKCITYDKLCRNQYSLQISTDVCLYQPQLSNIRNIGELKLIQNQQYLCHLKHNIYLLYPDRPKSLLNKYSIRISLYEKMK
jgi:hypothetical protein